MSRRGPPEPPPPPEPVKVHLKVNTDVICSSSSCAWICSSSSAAGGDTPTPGRPSVHAQSARAGGCWSALLGKRDGLAPVCSPHRRQPGRPGPGPRLTNQRLRALTRPLGRRWRMDVVVVVLVVMSSSFPPSPFPLPPSPFPFSPIKLNSFLPFFLLSQPPSLGCHHRIWTRGNSPWH